MIEQMSLHTVYSKIKQALEEAAACVQPPQFHPRQIYRAFFFLSNIIQLLSLPSIQYSEAAPSPNASFWQRSASPCYLTYLEMEGTAAETPNNVYLEGKTKKGCWDVGRAHTQTGMHRKTSAMSCTMTPGAPQECVNLHLDSFWKGKIPISACTITKQLETTLEVSNVQVGAIRTCGPCPE